MLTAAPALAEDQVAASAPPAMAVESPAAVAVPAPEASPVAAASPAVVSDPAPATSVAPPPASVGVVAQPVYDLPDPASLTMPAMAFIATPEIEDDFEKYFYFHRENTGYVEAFEDIRECDALASGSSYYANSSGAMAGAMAQYGVLGGALGGAIGSAIADAIFGSAERRKQRRINLRNCMGFKGYQRYGLSGELWKKFNFEEGNGRKKEGVRDESLELQALVASGPKPTTKELGL